MREVTFLPSWYPKVVRQRKLFATQVWATGAILCSSAVLLATIQWRTMLLRHQLADTQATADETVKAVHQLDELLMLQRQLVSKQSIVNELGLPVELSRLIAEMGSCAPREVAFTEVEATTVEQTPQSIASRAMAAASGKVGPTRRLELRLKGVAPTESEVTTFWSRLIQRPFMTQVRLIHSNEKIDGEHKMREFEITLHIPLDARPQEGM